MTSSLIFAPFVRKSSVKEQRNPSLECLDLTSISLISHQALPPSLALCRAPKVPSSSQRKKTVRFTFWLTTFDDFTQLLVSPSVKAPSVWSPLLPSLETDFCHKMKNKNYELLHPGTKEMQFLLFSTLEVSLYWRFEFIFETAISSGEIEVLSFHVSPPPAASSRTKLDTLLQPFPV